MAEDEQLTDAEKAAVDALVNDAGCLTERAVALTKAMAFITAEEALATVAGQAEVYGGVVDMRVARLRRLIGALDETAPVPNAYELSTLLRVTVPQARNVLRTYGVRHAAEYRSRMTAAVQRAVARGAERAGQHWWEIEFDDPDALAYAEELLRRRGLTRSLSTDKTTQVLSVRQDAKDRHAQSAVAALNCQIKD